VSSSVWDHAPTSHPQVLLNNFFLNNWDHAPTSHPQVLLNKKKSNNWGHAPTIHPQKLLNKKSNKSPIHRHAEIVPYLYFEAKRKMKMNVYLYFQF
jgi:hypothetical protein